MAESGLQSGFVLAVVIAAFLLSRYLGGSGGLTLRITQLGLGIVLMMLVFSATTAFHGPSAIPLTELGTMLDSERQLMELSNESAQRNSEVGTIHMGLGIILLALGVILFRKLGTITPALLLGGILLILLGPPTGGGGLDQLNPIFGLLDAVVPGTFNDAGKARDIARFVVLLVGATSLAGFLYFRWEHESPSDSGSPAHF